MPRHLTNVLLAAAVAGALVTGTAAFGTGSPAWGWALAVAHGVLGLVLVVLAVRKSRIVSAGWSTGLRGGVAPPTPTAARGPCTGGAQE